MNIELRDIDQVRPYPGNPRQNDEAVDAVAASLREFGFRQPIVVDGEGVIIVGHTRWKAAKKLGLAKVPVHVATDLSESQVKAYRIADNQTAAIAEWDYELLPIELSSLQEMDFDLNLLGFDQEELARLMSGDVQQGLTDPDDVPAPPDAATTQPGDLWILGNHRLLCGDSSKAEDVNRLLEGATIHLCNTDPPYNVRVEPRSNNAIAAGLSSFPASNAIEAADAGACITRGSTWPATRARLTPRTRNCGPRTDRWSMILSAMRNSTDCLRLGSATSPAYSHPAEVSTSGAATPIAPTIRRCSNAANCTFRKRSSG